MVRVRGGWGRLRGGEPRVGDRLLGEEGGGTMARYLASFLKSLPLSFPNVQMSSVDY